MYFDKSLFDTMHEKHTKSLKALDIMIELVDKILEDSKAPTDEFSVVSSFLLSKFYKSILSIRLLAVAGLEEDARSLLRILLEQLFTLCYLSQEPITRVRHFIEYNKVERINFLESIEKHYPNTFNGIDTNAKNTIINDYNGVKESYSRYKGWSGKSIRQIAIELGEEALYWYDIIYCAESVHVHSSVNSSKNFLLDNNGTTCVKVGPYPFDATDLFSKVAELTRDMIRQAMTNWRLDTSEINAVWSNCNDLLTQEFSEK